MGQTYIDSFFSNPQNPLHKIMVSGLVDTGATLPIIPESLARELGVKLAGRKPVITAKGDTVMDYAILNIEINGEAMAFKTLVSKTLKKVVIGLVVMETFGYKVNPVEHTLEKIAIEQY
ncbi:MAG TPA: aspartyl protease family protein [Candidatus Aquilonibacter sp.]|nr:aspartyl protease family protein [Candidatus Aquilonibacter sp.]